MANVGNLGEVPLRDLLPGFSQVAADAIIGAAASLDARIPAASGRPGWHWYPDHSSPPPTTPSGIVPLLFGTAVSLFDNGQDWLELAIDVAWSTPPLMTVTAAVEVACWCPTDHGTHAVQTRGWLAGDSEAIGPALATAVDAVASWLAEPRDPSVWRTRSRLPNPE